jgi:murein endopeptidase
MCHHPSVVDPSNTVPRRDREDPEVWLDPDEIFWFVSERRWPRAHRAAGLSRAVAAVVPGQPVLAAAGGAAIPFPSPALPARPRRRTTGREERAGWSARRRRRFATRLLLTATIVLATAMSVPWLLLRPAESPAGPAAVLTTALPAPSVAQPASPPFAPDLPIEHSARPEPRPIQAEPRAGADTREQRYPEIRWRESKAIGVPHDGRLVDGVGLPVEGPDWVTWDPIRERSPNRASRLYGTDRLVRVVLRVVRAYGRVHPDAPRVVIGDLSRRGGGTIDEHVSHQNGLDVDVYYPRLDHRLKPPSSVDQIDLRLARDLVRRFIAAGAQLVLVGYNTPLRGPSDIVLPYANHDSHMHVRIAQPAAGWQLE